MKMDALQKENEDLKGKIRDMVIEKSRIVDQLYRAFRKVLNSKKRKISELQREIDNMKHDNNNGKRAKREIPRILNISSDEEEDEQDEIKTKETTLDSDETDIDDVELETCENESTSTSYTHTPSPQKSLQNLTSNHLQNTQNNQQVKSQPDPQDISAITSSPPISPSIMETDSDSEISDDFVPVPRGGKSRRNR